MYITVVLLFITISLFSIFMKMRVRWVYFLNVIFFSVQRGLASSLCKRVWDVPVLGITVSGLAWIKRDSGILSAYWNPSESHLLWYFSATKQRVILDYKVLSNVQDVLSTFRSQSLCRSRPYIYNSTLD